MAVGTGGFFAPKNRSEPPAPPPEEKTASEKPKASQSNKETATIEQIREDLLEWQKASGDSRTGTPVLSVIDKGGSLEDVVDALHTLRKTTTHPKNTEFLDPIIETADAALHQTENLTLVEPPSKEAVNNFVDALTETLQKRGLTTDLDTALNNAADQARNGGVVSLPVGGLPTAMPAAPSLPAAVAPTPVLPTTSAPAITPQPTQTFAPLQPLQMQTLPQLSLDSLPALKPLAPININNVPALPTSSVLAKPSAKLPAPQPISPLDMQNKIVSTTMMPPPVAPLSIAAKSIDDMRKAQSAGASSITRPTSMPKVPETSNISDAAAIIASIFGKG